MYTLFSSVQVFYVLLYVFMTVLRVAVGVYKCTTCCCRCSYLFYMLLHVFMTVLRVAVGVLCVLL